MAADDAVVFVVNHRTEEPVAAGDDDVVEFVDLSGPFYVVLIQVEIEETSFGGAVGVPNGGSGEMRGPENGHGEVVAFVTPSLEIIVRRVRHINRIFHLRNTIFLSPMSPQLIKQKYFLIIKKLS